MNKFPRPLCNSMIVLEHAWSAIEDTKGGNVLECGVYEGFTSMILKFGLDKNKWVTKHYAADTFKGFPYSGKKDEKYKEGDLNPGDLVNIELRRFWINTLVGRVEDTLSDLGNLKFSFVFN